MKFNVNSEVGLKITNTGWKFIDQLNATDPVYKGNPLNLKPGKDGLVWMALWQVMQIFGPSCYMGFDPTFETDIELKEQQS